MLPSSVPTQITFADRGDSAMVVIAPKDDVPSFFDSMGCEPETPIRRRVSRSTWRVRSRVGFQLRPRSREMNRRLPPR